VEVASCGETGFNSSPKSKGMLVRARKTGLQNQKSVASSITAETHAPLDAEGASKEMSSDFNALLKRAITLGAEKTNWIDTETVLKSIQARKLTASGFSLHWFLSHNRGIKVPFRQRRVWRSGVISSKNDYYLNGDLYID